MSNEDEFLTGLGLFDSGRRGMTVVPFLFESTNRRLVPHETPHSTMRMLAKLCMLLPKVAKLRAIEDTMALITQMR